MSQLEYRSPPTLLGFTDKTWALITVGILLLLSALVLGCLTAAIPVSQMMPRPRGQSGAVVMPMGQLIASIAMYLALAIAFGSIGIGAILKRRWARPLALILCTHWTLAGIGTLVFVCALFPMMKEEFSKQGLGSSAAVGFVVAGAVFSSIFMIALPLSMLLMMRPAAVRETCEYYDPTPRWTDRCSLALLGGIVTLGVMGAVLLLAVPIGVVGFFGVLLTGPAAMLVVLMGGGAFLVSAWRMYHHDLRGWLLGLIATVLMTLSTVVTAFVVPASEFIRQTSNDPAQIEQVQRHEGVSRAMTISLSLLFGGALAVYIVRLRKHMLAPPAAIAV